MCEKKNQQFVQKSPRFNHRICSTNRPERYLKFWALRVGAYSRLGAYKIFAIFSKCSEFI